MTAFRFSATFGPRTWASLLQGYEEAGNIANAALTADVSRPPHGGWRGDFH